MIAPSRSLRGECRGWDRLSRRRRLKRPQMRKLFNQGVAYLSNSPRNDRSIGLLLENTISFENNPTSYIINHDIITGRKKTIVRR